MTSGAFAVAYHPAARAEYRNAERWYEHHNTLAALAFAEELRATIERIAEHPLRWPPFLHGTQRCLFHGFPYSVIYRVREQAVQVIAVAHQSRRPDYWKGRLRAPTRKRT